MNWKQFLKPNRRKIIVGLLFFVLISLSLPTYSFKAPTYGIPLEFYYVGHNPSSTFCQLPPCPEPWFNFPNLLIDLVFWYILSCLIVWIYDKFRKKK